MQMSWRKRTALCVACSDNHSATVGADRRLQKFVHEALPRRLGLRQRPPVRRDVTASAPRLHVAQVIRCAAVLQRLDVVALQASCPATEDTPMPVAFEHGAAHQSPSALVELAMPTTHGSMLP